MSEVRLLRSGDAHLLDAVEDGVFDGPLRPELVEEFLADERHHLAVAVDGGRVVGMASAVHYIHPDKPAELWINEVGVAEGARGRGVGGSLVDALLAEARALGCREAWVLADASNEPARRLYEREGGSPRQTVLYSWKLQDT